VQRDEGEGMDNVFWIIGFCVVCVFALTCVGGVLVFIVWLAQLISETIRHCGIAARSTKSWLIWVRWNRRYKRNHVARLLKKTRRRIRSSYSEGGDDE